MTTLIRVRANVATDAAAGGAHAGRDRIAGVNEPLPAGERVLWQGAPDGWTLARSALHVRKIAVYFALMLLARGAVLLSGGASLTQAIVGCLPLLVVAIAALALLASFAWAASRTTIYAITSGRVFMRVGVALPIFVNIPLSGIEAAALRVGGAGFGDLPLQLKSEVRLAYVHLWPHVRPWRLAHPEPMLRAIADASAVAQVLTNALAALPAPASAAHTATQTATQSPGITAGGNEAHTRTSPQSTNFGSRNESEPAGAMASASAA